MHHSTGRLRILGGGGVLLALLLCLTPTGHAQPDPKANVISVPLGGTKSLQMTTKQPISKILNKTGIENIVGIRRFGDDPTTVLLVGQQPGIDLVPPRGTEMTF